MINNNDQEVTEQDEVFALSLFLITFQLKSGNLNDFKSYFQLCQPLNLLSDLLS